jgi:SAM-dependent methyltransferase
MRQAPRLFEQALIRTRLARAIAAGGPDFLLQRAADDLADRLALVLRHFATVLDLGTPGPHAAHVIAQSGLATTLLRAAPVDVALKPGPWQGCVADAGLLPFGDRSLDAVISLLALQSVDDLPGSLVQIRRALRPDGLFLACLIGGTSLSELRESFADAEMEIEGGISPRVAPFADLRDLGGLLQRAGFALPVTDVDQVTLRYSSALALMRDLKAMGAANALIERRREPLRRATLLRAIEIYQQRFADPDGKVRATFELVWISGWSPDPSQQKPLKPGSATTKLADALEALRETKGE